MKTLSIATGLIAACAAQSDRKDYYVHYYANTSMIPFGEPAFSSVEPIATREVSFDRTLGVPRPQGKGKVLWNWKLSIGEVVLPNTTDFISEYNTQPDSKVAYTTFELSWPQEGNINEAVAAEYTGPPYQNESCIYHLWADLPQNVSDAWNSSSSSCRSAIGAECESYIIGSMGNMRGCIADNRPSLYRRPACAGSFGAATGNLATSGYAFGNVSGPVGDVGFHSGDRMAWTVTDSYATGNTTAFKLAKSRLYVMIMTNSYGTQVLCNRIGNGSDDMSGVADDLENGSDDMEDGSDDMENMSVRLSNSCTVLLGAAVLLAVGYGGML